MIRGLTTWLKTGWICATLGSIAALTFLAANPAPSAAPEEPAVLPASLSLDAAIQWALEHNPSLAAIREQHGIAAAAVMIAQTYPFNPMWEGRVRWTSSPANAGTTNVVPVEHAILLEWELRHQGQYRREGAAHALSRTDYEIAFQELSVAGRVMHAFDTALYREKKLQIVERTLKFNENVAREVGVLVEKNQLRAGDLLIARTEVDDTRTLLGPARAALVVARNDLRRLLGLVDESVGLKGNLGLDVPPFEESELIAVALERRPDRNARLAGVAEAEAALKLAQANRYGNPVVGPNYEYDNSRVNYMGVQFVVPLPVLNQHRGEIMQREAERGRAVAELRQTETQVRQDVQEAIQRLKEAKNWADSYAQTIKNLNQAHQEMRDQFLKNQPGADVLRLIDIRRKVLKAEEGYLDALWEMSQSRADLAAAVADPRLACPAEPLPDAPPK
jgi:outer membrane protein TolC